MAIGGRVSGADVNSVLLDSTQMATFVARGFLRFDAVVPSEINEQFMDEAGRPDLETGDPATVFGDFMASSRIPEVAPGTRLDAAYAEYSAIARMLEVPLVRGAVESLVGANPIFDHHFLHVTFPPRFYEAIGRANAPQHTHQDSTIDPRRAFDVQIMYFPHEVTAQMGGTRFVPGTHLRIVSEAAVGRYQNIRGQQHVVCPAGTVLFMHHGIWHGGGMNTTEQPRYMFKIRLQPAERQTRLWDTSDLGNDHFSQRPIFYVKTPRDSDHVHHILTRPERWFEADTGRLEYLNRVRLWRHVLGDDTFDADYWLTRIENEPD